MFDENKARELLFKAAEQLEEEEYSKWYNSCTCLSYEEYRSKHIQSLIEELTTMANVE